MFLKGKNDQFNILKFNNLKATKVNRQKLGRPIKKMKRPFKGKATQSSFPFKILDVNKGLYRGYNF